MLFLRLKYKQLLSEKVKDNKDSHAEHHRHIVHNNRGLRTQYMLHKRLRRAERNQITDDNISGEPPG